MALQRPPQQPQPHGSTLCPNTPPRPRQWHPLHWACCTHQCNTHPHPHLQNGSSAVHPCRVRHLSGVGGWRCSHSRHAGVPPAPPIKCGPQQPHVSHGISAPRNRSSSSLVPNACTQRCHCFQVLTSHSRHTTPPHEARKQQHQRALQADLNKAHKAPCFASP
jgi:hypothetical protein